MAEAAPEVREPWLWSRASMRLTLIRLAPCRRAVYVTSIPDAHAHLQHVDTSSSFGSPCRAASWVSGRAVVLVARELSRVRKGPFSSPSFWRGLCSPVDKVIADQHANALDDNVRLVDARSDTLALAVAPWCELARQNQRKPCA